MRYQEAIETKPLQSHYKATAKPLKSEPQFVARCSVVTPKVHNKHFQSKIMQETGGVTRNRLFKIRDEIKTNQERTSMQ